MLFKRGDLPALLTADFKNLRKFDRDLVRILNDLFTSLYNMFDKGLTFEENMVNDFVEFTSNGAPDTEDTVAHTLGKVPTGFIVYSLDKAAVVYKSTTAWTSTNIYLKTSVATVAVKIIVF